MIPVAIPWRLVGAAIGLALLIAGAAWIQNTIRTQDREIAILQADNAVKDAALQGAVDALDEINQQHARDMAAVVADGTRARAQTQSDDKIIEEVHHVANPVRSAAACPADPAYDLELDRLQQRAAASGGADAPGGTGDGAGAAAGADRPPGPAAAQYAGLDLLHPVARHPRYPDQIRRRAGQM